MGEQKCETCNQLGCGRMLVRGKAYCRTCLETEFEGLEAKVEALKKQHDHYYTLYKDTAQQVKDGMKREFRLKDKVAQLTKLIEEQPTVDNTGKLSQ